MMRSGVPAARPPRVCPSPRPTPRGAVPREGRASRPSTSAPGRNAAAALRASCCRSGRTGQHDVAHLQPGSLLGQRRSVPPGSDLDVVRVRADGEHRKRSIGRRHQLERQHVHGCRRNGSVAAPFSGCERRRRGGYGCARPLGIPDHPRAVGPRVALLEMGAFLHRVGRRPIPLVRVRDGAALLDEPR